MKFTYEGQTVDLFDEEYFPDGIPKAVVVNCSGGLDSTSLLFLLATYFPEVEKHVFTGDDVHAPWDAMRAQDIVDWIQNNVPNHNITTHDILPFDDRDPEILNLMEKRVEEDPSLYDKYPLIEYENAEKTRRQFLGKLAKPWINTENTISVMRKYGCKRYLAAMTQNPPNSEMDRLNFAHLAETKRNEDRDDVHVFNKGGISYHPYARVNKLFVKGVFESHNLMDTLVPLTGSCTGGPNDTDYFQKPCGKCFWCHEKKWAFGHL